MKFAKTAALAIAMLAALSSQASAQATAPVKATPLFYLNSIGVGLVIIGAAMGIGKIAAAAVESMARQPEIAANIQTAMIIAAALIEGVAFFALIVLGFVVSGA